MHRRLAVADVEVVAVERDVERAEPDLGVAVLGDQGAQALGQRDAAGVDPDERDLGKVGVALDDLVGDALEGAGERIRVEQCLLGLSGRSHSHTPFRSLWTELKDWAEYMRPGRTV